MATLLMKCGHVALAKRQDGTPVCPICVGLIAGADQIAEVIPDLNGRMSKCSECGSTLPSSVKLPFFAWRPKDIFDSHYDGCKGWD